MYIEMKYNEYKQKRREAEKINLEDIPGQMMIFDFLECLPEEKGRN